MDQPPSLTGLFRLVTAGAVLAGGLCVALADGPSRRNVISLKALEFDIRQGAPSIDAALEIEGYDAQVEGFHLVHFRRPITDAAKLSVREAGARLYGYFPMHTLGARMDAATRQRVEALEAVDWVGVFQPSWKLAPGLRSRLLEPFDRGRPRDAVPHEVVLTVGFWPGEGSSSAERILALGGEVANHRRMDGVYEFMDVTIDPRLLRALARVPGVLFVEQKRSVLPLNDRARVVSRADEVASIDFLTGLDPTLDGAFAGFRVKIGHYDSGIQASHPDLTTPHLGFEPGANTTDASGHGTHVVGSMIGDGSRSFSAGSPPGSALPVQVGQFRGIVPKAALHHISWSQGLSDTVVLERMSQEGCHLMNNSWCNGSGSCDTDYGADTVVWDAGVWDADVTTAGLQPMVVFFAAGNDGFGAFNGCSGSGDQIASPGTAKNVITVGASMADRACGSDGDRDYVAATFSSRGPVDPDLTGQGLVKPDLLQMGAHVISTRAAAGAANDTCSTVGLNYRYGDGTSNSTPLVTGIGAAIYLDYVNNLGVAQPKPSLIKATLINGAFGVDNANCPGQYGFEVDKPTIIQGWGFADMVRSLYGPSEDPLDRTIYFENEEATHAVATGEVYEFDVVIDPSGHPFKFNLVWTDYPATVGAGSPLVVNDLDLELISPGGLVYYGNNFSRDWSVDAVTSAVRDRYNVVESVYIETPEVGRWTARIVGESVTQDMEPARLGTNQNFSVVYSAQVAPCLRPDSPALSVEPILDPWVDLSWPAVSGVTGYNVYRSTSSCDSGLSILTATTQTTYRDEAVTIGETYYYVVRGDDGGCESLPSNCIVVTLGPRLSYAGSSFCDGNDDGRVDPGETVSMPVALFNDGLLEASNVSALLGTSTAGVTILDPGATFPDIPQQSSGLSSPQTFTFEVDSSVACGSAIDFSIDATADGGVWADSFQVTVGEIIPLNELTSQSSSFSMGKNRSRSRTFSPELTLPTVVNGAIFTPPALSGYSTNEITEYVQISLEAPSGWRQPLKGCNQALQSTYDITNFYNFNGPGEWTLCVSNGDDDTCTDVACDNQPGSWPDLSGDGATIEVTSQLESCAPSTAEGSCGPEELSDVGSGEPSLEIGGPAPETITVEADAEVTGYNVYTDLLGNLFGTPSKTCHITSWTDNGDGTVSFSVAVPAGSWVLVTGSNAMGEGSAGRGSDLAERTHRGSWDLCGAVP